MLKCFNRMGDVGEVKIFGNYKIEYLVEFDCYIWIVRKIEVYL